MIPLHYMRVMSLFNHVLFVVFADFEHEGAHVLVRYRHLSCMPALACSQSRFGVRMRP